MQPTTPDREYFRLVESYNASMIERDQEGLARALAVPIPEMVLRTPHLHARIRHLRGNSLCWLGLNRAAEHEYGLGFYESPKDEKGDYLLDRGMAAFAGLFTGSFEDRSAAATRCLEVLDLANQHVDELADPKYLIAAIASVRAFIFVHAGNAERAREELLRIRPEPLPREFSAEDTKLASFFTQLPKGLLAAIELKEPALLARLSAAILSPEEADSVMSTQMSAGEQLLYTLSMRVDVPKFRDGWVVLVDAVHLLFPKFPRSRRFRSLASSEAEFQQLTGFLNSRQ